MCVLRYPRWPFGTFTGRRSPAATIVLITLLVPAIAVTSGCAIPDTRPHATVLETDPVPGTAKTASEAPSTLERAARGNAATKTGDPDAPAAAAPRTTGTTTAEATDGTAPDTVSASGRTSLMKAADPDAGRFRSSPPHPAAWAAPLRKRPRRSPSAVLDRAPLRGTVNLVTVREVDGRPVVDTVSTPDLTRARQVVTAALTDPEVLDVSLASTVRIQATDPYRDAQWALTRLSAEQVWSSQRGNGVTVAVLDTGVDARHPDLAGVVLSGRDFVASGNGQLDAHGHGTHVAGAISSLAGNGIGTAGLGQGVRILPVRVLGADGAGTDADVANGVVWAVDRGARVINLSVGSPDYSAAEDAAIAYALQHDVVVVSAAGNMRAQGNPTIYPAAFPGVIGVGASDTSDRPAAFSSTGAGVDLLAPGVDIVSTYPPNTYAYMDGTSMSAPLVTATAALVRAAAPRATPGDVAIILTRSARDVGASGRDNSSGYGLVQPLAALDLAKQVAGGAALPGRAITSAAVSSLDVVSAPYRAPYLSLARVVFRLTSGGKGLAGAQVAMCSTAAPSQTLRCLTRRTDSSGRISLAVRASGTLTVSARYAGSSRVANTVSRPVLINVLPRVPVKAGIRIVTTTVNPVARGTRVRLLQRVGSRWRTVATRTLPSTGRLSFTRLTRGAVYRVAVPATDRTMAAVSSAVRVR